MKPTSTNTENMGIERNRLNFIDSVSTSLSEVNWDMPEKVAFRSL